MNGDPGVIQTTAAKHMARRDEAIEASRTMLQFTTNAPQTEGELDAYLRGARDFWGFATFAILRDGNCRFEKE
jgi:hypothetical protein